MQLTRLDRWLRERFVYETQVFTLRQPPELPAGVIGQEIPEAPGRRFRHRFIARKPEQAEQLIATLKENNQMFTTRVVDRQAWYVHLIAPKGKSITYWFAWTIITAIGGYTLAVGIRALWSRPEIRENVLDAINVLQM